MLGTVLGAVGVLLAAAAFGVSGLIAPASNVDFRQTGQVILEQGTGAHFVFGGDGLLHPVINEASALLLAGADKTVTAPASALSTAPRGATLGIPGAPDSLPPAGSLLTPALVTCSSVTGGQPAAGTPESAVLLTGAGRSAGGLSGMRGLAAGRGLLVQPPGGVPYLITGGHRYRLPTQAAVVALGYENVAPLPVAAQWLSTLPAGRGLGLVAVPGAGNPGPVVGGAATSVGQVLATSGALGGPASYYLVRASGLEPISQTEAVLVLADTANAGAYPGAAPSVLKSSLAAVASAPPHPSGADASGYPSRLPAPAGVGSGRVVVCAVGNGGGARVVLGSGLPLPQGARAVRTGAGPGSGVANEVYVPPGSGALVTAPPSPGAGAATYLVTDEGMRFRVANADALRSLGYGSVRPAPVSSSVLALLPTGPALDPAAAQAMVPGGAG